MEKLLARAREFVNLAIQAQPRKDQATTMKKAEMMPPTTRYMWTSCTLLQLAWAVVSSFKKPGDTVV